MTAATSMGKWPLLLVPVLLLIFLGGYVFDAMAVNLANIQTMAETAVQSGSITAWGDCRQLHVSGRNLYRQGQYSQSLPLLEQAAACSDDQWAWFDLGQAQYQLGDLAGAAESWQKTEEGYIQAVRLAQMTAQSGGDIQAQIDAWTFASQVNPTAHAPYIQRARLVAETNPEQYQAILEQAIEANPEAPTAFIELGNHFQELGEVAQAQTYFEQAYAIDPTDVSLLVRLAENATLLGDAPSAIAYWQEVALRNERRRAAAYYQIGQLAFNDNNYSSALAFYQRAVEINPESGQFLLGLANTYFALGCRQEATDAYQDILSVAESEEILAETQQKLADVATMTNVVEPCPDGS